jgi:hypothetical protein
LSSTTDPRQAKGQVLVIFGLSLFTIIVIAALAFDTGMMLLERRDQQNASDAASLAGARHLPDDPSCLTTPSLANCPRAHAEALNIGTANGFTDGTDDADVVINIPPQSGLHIGLPGYVEVLIHSNRPSIFGGVIGVFGWDVSARAVAANQPGLDLPFSMLTLDPSGCKSLQVTGSGSVTSAGTIQVNSSCAPDALFVGGTGILTVTADGAVCNAVGEMDEQGVNADLDCVQQEHSYSIQDPLRNLPAPPLPGYPADMIQIGGPSKSVPNGCPGSGAAEATAEAPAPCKVNAGPYATTVWRVFPGYYPGGFDLQKGTFYFEPGIYYIGGGGFRVAGASVQSVDAGGTTFGGGLLIYNTEASLFHDACAAGTGTAAQCIGQILLNSGTATLNLKQLSDGSNWDGLVIFQDRNLSLAAGDEVQLNGGDSDTEVAGTIYVPSGDVKVNGSDSALILDQVIAFSYKINGSGGTIDVLYRTGVTAHVSGVGLVE